MAYVPSLAYEPDSAYVPSSSSLLDNTSSLVTSLDADNDDEDPPSPVLIRLLALAPPTAPHLLRWVRST